ncbi:hypothetical protein [Thiolapillus sp.]|uniref:hypothetical protein n=1 Tax=Thiolapillus sp. TaxID=2017437 RepID=UPI003AF7840C
MTGHAALIDRIKSLPQAAHIKDESIDRYLKVVSNDPEHNALWHIRRLTGWGGSEIGTLVANYRGMRSTFTSARDLVAQKLLMQPPQKADNLMRRGNLLEPVIAEIARRDFNATRDEESLNAIQAAMEAQQTGEHEWMRVYPDDVLLINGKRILTDYKAPTEAPTSLETSLEYACQLHQGAHLLLQEGIKLDGMAIFYYNHAKGEIMPVQVPWDQQLYDDMLVAGDYYWDCVLKGELPPYITPEREALPEYTEEQAAELGRRIEETASLFLMKQDIEARFETASKALAQLATLGGTASPAVLKELPYVTAYQRESIDNTTLMDIMRQQGLGESDLFRESGALDATGMAELLINIGRQPLYKKVPDKKRIQAYCQEHGIEPPVSVSTSFGLKAVKRKQVSKDDIENWKEKIHHELDGAISRLAGGENEDERQQPVPHP